MPSTSPGIFKKILGTVKHSTFLMTSHADVPMAALPLAYTDTGSAHAKHFTGDSDPMIYPANSFM